MGLFVVLILMIMRLGLVLNSVFRFGFWWVFMFMMFFGSFLVVI